MKRWFWWLPAGVLLAVLIPLSLGWKDLPERLQAFPLALLPALFMMILLCWCINAVRLRFLLAYQPLGFFKRLGVVISSEFAYCTTPGGAGAPVVQVMLLKRAGMSTGKAMGVYALDQVTDLIVLVVALLAILAYGLSHHLGSNMAWMLGSGATMAVAGLSLLALLGHFHQHVLRMGGLLLSRLGMSRARLWRLARRLLSIRNAFSNSLHLPGHHLALVLLLTSLHWVLRYSVLYLVLLGLGREVDWALTFLVQMLALTAGQFSLLPGGAGTAELASLALLGPMVGKSTAAAAVLIWRLVTYHFYLVLGAPVFLHCAGRPLWRRLTRA